MNVDDLTPSEQTEYTARMMAVKAGVDPDLVAAIGHTESGWNPDVQDSKAGAIGPMQITPDTGKLLGYSVDQLRDPVTNLEAGIRLLKQYHARYGGNVPDIATAYNAGPGNVGKARIPDETRNYIAKIQRELGNKAVDIPETQALVQQNLDAANAQDSVPRQMATRAIAPPLQLSETAFRLLTGSPIPPPPIAQLAKDAVETAAMVAPAYLPGRIASAAVQGGASLASGLIGAAQEHQAGRTTWDEAAKAMDANDAMNIGLQTIAGATLGAVFAPGKTAVSPGRALRETPMPLRTVATADAVRKAEQAEVSAAYAQLPKKLPVDATDWLQVIHERQQAGESIPREIQAIAERAEPMAVDTLGPHGEPITTASGRYTLPLGDLLDANLRLGDMVNTKEGRLAAQAAGHSTKNLGGLKSDLLDATSASLQQMDAQYGTGVAPQLAAAQRTAGDVATKARARALVEHYVNPDTGAVAGDRLLAKLTGPDRYRIIKTLGQDQYDQLVGYATTIRKVTQNPAKTAVLHRIFGLHSLLYASGAGAAHYFGAPEPIPAALIAGRVAYVLATSKPARVLLDQMARAPVSSPAFIEAAGRLALATSLAGSDAVRDVGAAGPPSQPSPSPTPRMFSQAAMPPPR